MSVYYDKTKEMYVVRSYRKGVWSYVGQYLFKLDAETAEADWKHRQKLEEKEGPKVHSLAWFIKTSKQQRIDLSAKFREIQR